MVTSVKRVHPSLARLGCTQFRIPPLSHQSFFQSLVDGWGERIIAILLSGTGQTIGGEIGVHSELRQGATFWFSVPLAIAKFYKGGCKFAKTDDPTRQSADGV
jgi:hypothetical protein